MSKIDLDNFRVVKSGNSDHDLNYINAILHAIVAAIKRLSSGVAGVKRVRSDASITITGSEDEPSLSALPAVAQANRYTDNAINDLNFLEDAPSDGKTYGRLDGAWAVVLEADDFADVAFSGDFNDLVNKPVIPTVPVLSVNGKIGHVVLGKSDVGLGNVDNTSDMNKPVSTATQTELNKKANTSDLADVAFSGSYTDLVNTPAIPNVPITSIGASSPITVTSSGTTRTIGHSNSGVTTGTYAYPSSVTVNATGHVTSIAGGPTPLVNTTGIYPIMVSGTGTSRQVGHANSGVVEGTYEHATVEVDAKGHVVQISSNPAPVTTVTGTAPINVAGIGDSRIVSHTNSGVTAGTYTNATVTINAQGHVTSASSGTASGGVWGSITGIIANQTDLQNALNGKGGLSTSNTWTQGQSYLFNVNNRVYIRPNLNALDSQGNNGGAIYFGVGVTSATIPTAGIEASWGGSSQPQMHLGVIRDGKKAWASFHYSSSLNYGIVFGHGTTQYLNMYHGGADFTYRVSSPGFSVPGGTASQVLNANGTVRNITISSSAPTGGSNGDIWYQV